MRSCRRLASELSDRLQVWGSDWELPNLYMKLLFIVSRCSRLTYCIQPLDVRIEFKLRRSMADSPKGGAPRSPVARGGARSPHGRGRKLEALGESGGSLMEKGPHARLLAEHSEDSEEFSRKSSCQDSGGDHSGNSGVDVFKSRARTGSPAPSQRSFRHAEYLAAQQQGPPAELSHQEAMRLFMVNEALAELAQQLRRLREDELQRADGSGDAAGEPDSEGGERDGEGPESVELPRARSLAHDGRFISLSGLGEVSPIPKRCDLERVRRPERGRSSPLGALPQQVSALALETAPGERSALSPAAYSPSENLPSVIAKLRMGASGAALLSAEKRTHLRSKSPVELRRDLQLSPTPWPVARVGSARAVDRNALPAEERDAPPTEQILAGSLSPPLGAIRRPEARAAAPRGAARCCRWRARARAPRPAPRAALLQSGAAERLCKVTLRGGLRRTRRWRGRGTRRRPRGVNLEGPRMSRRRAAAARRAARAPPSGVQRRGRSSCTRWGACGRRPGLGWATEARLGGGAGAAAQAGAGGGVGAGGRARPTCLAQVTLQRLAARARWERASAAGGGASCSREAVRRRPRRWRTPPARRPSAATAGAAQYRMAWWRWTCFRTSYRVPSTPTPRTRRAPPPLFLGIRYARQGDREAGLCPTPRAPAERGAAPVGGVHPAVAVDDR